MIEQPKGLGTDLCIISFFILLILKVTGNISLSWWWITAPIWIPATLILIAAFYVLIFINLPGNKDDLL